MKTIHYILIAIAIILIFTTIKYWSKIKQQLSPDEFPADGTPCATGGFVGGNNGVYKNGVCVKKTTPVIIVNNTDGMPCITPDNHAGIMKGGVCVYVKPVEGSACKINGKWGTIKNGVCVVNNIIPAEGSACTTSNGKAGTIKNGVCIENNIIPQDGTACTTSTGKAGTIKGGICVENVPNGSPCVTATGQVGTMDNGICRQTYQVEGQPCKTVSGKDGILKKGICVENPPDGTVCVTSNGKAGTMKSGICIENPAEGSACTTSTGKAGTIKNGICVETIVSGKIEVINPMGAEQYYQHLSQSGEYLYDKVNIAPAPFGTQFNKLNTGPWSNPYVLGNPELYETDNKSSGQSAGFYLASDFKIV